MFLQCLYANFSVSCQLDACTRMLDFLCTLPTDTSQAAANQPVKKHSSKRTAATGESHRRDIHVCIASPEDNNLYNTIQFGLIPLFIVVLWWKIMETVPAICHSMMHVFLSRSL